MPNATRQSSLNRWTAASYSWRCERRVSRVSVVEVTRAPVSRRRAPHLNVKAVLLRNSARDRFTDGLGVRFGDDVAIRAVDEAPERRLGRARAWRRLERFD